MTPGELPPEPADFTEFWASVAARADALPPTLTLGAPTRAPGPLARTHVLHEMTFTSTDDFRIGGWVLLPQRAQPTRNLTFVHGYGGRAAPDFEAPLIAPDDAVILPCLRGLGASSTRPDIPVPGPEHVLHGIESKDTYVLGGCVADIWRATAELDHLTGPAEHRYYGASFGGGLGAFALMGGRYSRAALYVPTFGPQPLRMGLPSVGSNAGLRGRHAHDPGILDVLAYFDSVTAATHVTTPTMVAAALWDPSVPPVGQFAVHHALAGEKRLVVQDAGHTDYPGDARQHAARNRHIHRWLHEPR
ncbi:MAG: acetylxylan esterase [Propionibacterium sp.]|nr:acetylxylan esterase [Propionibacterium sp.]